MFSNWSKIGKIKVIALIVIAIPNIFFPYYGFEIENIKMPILFFLFGCFAFPIISFIGRAIFDGIIEKPKWSDNPLLIKRPLSVLQFVAFIFISIGISIVAGSYLNNSSLNFSGLGSVSFGLGTLIGILVTYKWKKLRLIYFISGGIIITTSPLFLIRSYTSDEDIIKHYSENFEKYSNTIEKVIINIEDLNLLNNTEYSGSYYYNSLDYIILKNYIYREESIEIPDNVKREIDILCDTIECSNYNLMKDKYYRFSTGLRNWYLNHIYIIKVVDDSILSTKYKNWEIIFDQSLPSNNKNWIFHLKDNWYIESKISDINTNIKFDFPFEFDLSEQHSYDKNKRLESIGRHYSYQKNGDYIYLKHGKWLYVDSNEYIIKEQMFCFDTLIYEKFYDINDSLSHKIRKKRIKTYVDGKWIPDVDYIID